MAGPRRRGNRRPRGLDRFVRRRGLSAEEQGPRAHVVRRRKSGSDLINFSQSQAAAGYCLALISVSSFCKCVGEPWWRWWRLRPDGRRRSRLVVAAAVRIRVPELLEGTSRFALGDLLSLGIGLQTVGAK